MSAGTLCIAALVLIFAVEFGPPLVFFVQFVWWLITGKPEDIEP